MLSVKAKVSHVLHELGVFRTQNLIYRHADREWLSRMLLEPNLHPLHDQWHDQLEDEKVIIGNHLKERIDDGRHKTYVAENRTPMSQSRKDADQFIVHPVGGYWEPLVQVFVGGMNSPV